MRLLADKLAFVDGLRWRDDRFWFSDMHAGRVQTVTCEGELSTVVQVPGQPSGLGWRPNGDLLVVSMSGQRILRLEGRRLALHADLSGLADWDCNDMLVDPVGRAYVGCLGFDFWNGEAPRPTRLLMVDPDGKAIVAAEDLMCPNGMALLQGGAVLVVAESFGERITAFDRDSHGRLRNRRVLAELPGGVPDGIGKASEDAFWVADCRRRLVLRIGLDGRVSRRLQLPDGRMPIDCAVGGPGGQHLAVSSAPSGAPDRSGLGSRVEIVPLKGAPLRLI